MRHKLSFPGAVYRNKTKFSVMNYWNRYSMCWVIFEHVQLRNWDISHMVELTLVSCVVEICRLGLEPVCDTNLRLSVFTYVTAHSPTLFSLLLRHRIFTYFTWRAAHGGSAEYYVNQKAVTQYVLHCLHFTHHTVSKRAVVQTLLVWTWRWGEYCFVYFGKPFMNVCVPHSKYIMEVNHFKNIFQSL